MPGLEAPVGNTQPPLPGVLPRGTMLRGYEVKSALGKGAFGITYRALDATLDRDVAIKEYLPTTLALREGRTTVLPHSPEHAEQFVWGRERFLDEARTLARLDRTTAIVRVFDFLEANGTAYMVMALIEGETLSKRLTRETRLMPEAADRLLAPLLDGLEELHAATFLHRDIKPANIMVDDQGRPTLIDFGAARAAMVGRSTSMTAVFTPGYAAVEQFVPSSKLGPWTDIYGLSATFYQATTGRIPPSAFERILNDTYESLSELQPEGYPSALLAGIDAGLALHATDRPQSIAEWKQMLRPGSTALEATRIARKPGPLARAARNARKAGPSIKVPVVSAGVAAALVLLAGGGYLAFRANVPAPGSSATLDLSTEQLEQVLAERRKADALVVEKRRLEEEARQKAGMDAEAKRQADVQLDQARQALQRAEQELATLKTDIEARRQPASGQVDQAVATQRAEEEAAAQRKAEAEADALRVLEEEAAKNAEAEAEAKRRTDQALAVAEAQRKQAEAEALAKAEMEVAARRQASQEAQRKAESEAANRRQGDEAQAKAQAEREKVEAAAKIKADAKAEADKAAAALAKLKEEGETAEKTLRLEQPERQRLQVALTSLGFDTRGTDGIVGPRSREMIAAWQKARNQPATGFLNRTQHLVLLKEAEPALGKYAEDERKKIKEQAGRVAAARPAPSASGPTSADGLWRGTYACDVGAASGISSQIASPAFTLGLELRVSSGSASSGDIPAKSSNGRTRAIQIAVSPTGGVEVKRLDEGSAGAKVLSGQLEGNAIRASGKEFPTQRGCTLALTRVPEATPSAGPYDGVYSGSAASVSGASAWGVGQSTAGAVVTIRVDVNGGHGSGTISARGCGDGAFSFGISTTGDVKGAGLSCDRASFSIHGHAEGRLLDLVFVPSGGGQVPVRLTRQGN